MERINMTNPYTGESDSFYGIVTKETKIYITIDAYQGANHVVATFPKGFIDYRSNNPA